MGLPQGRTDVRPYLQHLTRTTACVRPFRSGQKSIWCFRKELPTPNGQM